jgi:iron complex outermembrane receptor protein
VALEYGRCGACIAVKNISENIKIGSLMKSSKKLLSCLIAASCASLSVLSFSAFAQEAGEKLRNDLEEIVVVSTMRTGTDLANTSASVTALPASALVTAGITDPTNLQDLAPNISIDRAGSNGLQITIRGVSSTDNTEKGDPSASFLQDGIYIARSQAQEVSFFDLEQVEILRGPQGTLYGRNATAGIINILSAKPTMDDFYGSVEGTVGDYGKIQTTGVVNVPLSDSAALRAAVNIDKRDTYLNKNPNSPYDIDPGKDNMSVRLSGLFDIGEDVSLLVRGDHSTLEGTGRSSVKLSNFYDIDTVATVNDTPIIGRGTNPRYIGGSQSTDKLSTVGWTDNNKEKNDGSTWGVMSEVNWAINDQLTMTYLGSYREFERRELDVTGYTGLLDLGFTAFDVVSDQRFIGDYDQTSSELRFTYVTDTMNLQGGVYYFDETSDIEFLIIGAINSTPGGDGYVFGFPQIATSESLGVFAQGSFDLTDQLSLTVGARQTEDEKARVGATIFHQTFEEERSFVNNPATGNFIPDSLNNAEVEYSELTWKIGLDYHLNDEVLLYANVSTGYKSGGFNDGCLVGTTNCSASATVTEEALFYDPETLTSYEAGVKMDFENGLRTFVSVFQYDYKDLQLSALSEICGGPCQVTTNAGEAEVTGLEVESRYFINDRTKLNVAFTWLDAKYTDYQLNDTVNLKGNVLNRSPEYTAFIGLQHIMPLDNGGDIVFDANYRWSDSYAILNTNIVAQFEQPSFSKTDISVTYNAPDERWYVQGFVKNIEDELTISNAEVSAQFSAGFKDGTVNISDPRTAGVRFGLNF